jgi:hypothetical protein
MSSKEDTTPAAPVLEGGLDAGSRCEHRANEQTPGAGAEASEFARCSFARSPEPEPDAEPVVPGAAGGVLPEPSEPVAPGRGWL